MSDKEAIASMLARAEQYRLIAGERGPINSHHLWEASGDLFEALRLLSKANSHPEERAAWDRYAAAAMDIVGGTHRNEFAATAAKVADEMLTERRKRFGDGSC